MFEMSFIPFACRNPDAMLTTDKPDLRLERIIGRPCRSRSFRSHENRSVPVILTSEAVQNEPMSLLFHLLWRSTDCLADTGAALS